MNNDKDNDIARTLGLPLPPRESVAPAPVVAGNDPRIREALEAYRAAVPTRIDMRGGRYHALVLLALAALDEAGVEWRTFEQAIRLLDDDARDADFNGISMRGLHVTVD